ncbi:hypothetical protein [Vulcanisaeta distributa]|uniref:hypothetical protein n=1 Tax=Vulcanisaeta distributa TaxID=164451 RepID=UPI001FB2262A|nr:hypothetical protein [Vulcanisaeta distributa]
MIEMHRLLPIAILVITILTLAHVNYAFAIQPTDFGWVCEQGPMVAEGVLWTPIILLNSPYAGNASATQGLTYTATYTFTSGPVTLTSQVSTQLSQTIYANNGQAVGLFRLDVWAIYSTEMVAVPYPAYEPCTQSYVAQDLGPALVNNAPYYKVIQILPPGGTTTDQNEPNQVYATIYNGTGYYSVTFNNGFSNNLVGTYDMCSANTLMTLFVSSTSTTLLTTGVGVSINGYSSSGSATIQTTTTNAWTYTLEPGYIYTISKAGGQGGPAYAFETQPAMVRGGE